jgi:hypothetical protein
LGGIDGAAVEARMGLLLRGNCGDEKQSGYEQRGHFTHHEIPRA